MSLAACICGCFSLLMYHRGWDGWCSGGLGLGEVSEIVDGIQAASMHGWFCLNSCGCVRVCLCVKGMGCFDRWRYSFVGL